MSAVREATQEMGISLSRLEAFNPDTGLANVVIDTPRGSRAKYKYDEKQGLFGVGKLLPLGTSFPYNFGFVPSTRGQDGDAVDLLVLLDEPLVLGCLAPVHVVGAIQAEQAERGQSPIRNDRLLGVVQTRYNPPQFQSIEDLPTHLLEDIEQFFVSYNRSEGREFRPVGRLRSAQAMELLKRQVESRNI